MLIKTQPHLTHPLMVYRCLDPKHTYWIIDDNDESSSATKIQIEFGRVVLGILTFIRKSSDCKEPLKSFNSTILDEQNVVYYSDKASLILNGKTIDKNKPLLLDNNNDAADDNQYIAYNWQEHIDILINAIENRSTLSTKKRFDIYNRYRNFAACALCKQQFVPNVDKSKYPSSKSPAIMTGFKIGKDGRRYAKITVKGYDELFALDLWEILLNDNVSTFIRQCNRCKDFFKANSRKVLYCNECRKLVKKENNAKNRQNPIYKLKKSILEKITRNTTRSETEQNKLKWEFENEFDYYRDIIEKGYSDIPHLPTYNSNIKTIEDLINWLKEYEDKVRVYKKRKRKSDEEV